MKLLVVLAILSAFGISSDAGVSMNNPFYCYTSDTIRPSITMHSTSNSYEAIRHIKFGTPPSTYNSSKVIVEKRECFENTILLSLHSIEVLVHRKLWKSYATGS